MLKCLSIPNPISAILSKEVPLTRNASVGIYLRETLGWLLLKKYK